MLLLLLGLLTLIVPNPFLKSTINSINTNIHLQIHKHIRCQEYESAKVLYRRLEVFLYQKVKNILRDMV